jgi:hypothetical protein
VRARGAAAGSAAARDPGRSRAQRFEPAVAEELTGLPAFNFAVQNSRPEDAFYDGAHVQAADARRILAQAVKDAPAGFRWSRPAGGPPRPVQGLGRAA